MFHPKKHKEFFLKGAKNKSLQSAIDEMRREYERKLNSVDVDSDNDDACYICHSGGTLILCDGCPNACHFYCADPPIDCIPDGSWYCSECLKNKRGDTLLPFFTSPTSITSAPPGNNSTSEVGNAGTHRTHPTIKNAMSESAIDLLGGKEDDVNSLSESIRVIQSYSARPTDPVPRILERQYWYMLTLGATEFNSYNRRFSSTMRRRNASKHQNENLEAAPKKSRLESGEQPTPRHHRQRQDVPSSSAGLSQLIAAAHRVSTPDSGVVVATGTLSSTPLSFTLPPTVAVLSPVRSTPCTAKRSLLPCNSSTSMDLDAMDITNTTTTTAAISTASVPPSSEKRYLLFVRYRFDDEQEHDYRLLKRYLVFPEHADCAAPNTISGEFIKSLLFQDNASLHHQVLNAKYFDFSPNRQGWLHMHDRDSFIINSSSHVTVIKLLLLRDRGQRHKFSHHTSVSARAQSRRGDSVRHRTKRRHLNDEDDSGSTSLSDSDNDSNSAHKQPNRKSQLSVNGSWVHSRSNGTT